jgi:hypothetical protein
MVLPGEDRLHRTLRLNVPQLAITLGFPAYIYQVQLKIWKSTSRLGQGLKPEDNKLTHVLKPPFLRQRDY